MASIKISNSWNDENDRKPSKSVALNIDHLMNSRARNSTIRSATSAAGTAFSRSGRYRRATCREMMMSNPFLYPSASCLYLFLILLLIVCAAVQFVALSQGKWIFSIDRVAFRSHSNKIHAQLGSELRDVRDWCLAVRT